MEAAARWNCQSSKLSGLGSFLSSDKSSQWSSVGAKFGSADRASSVVAVGAIDSSDMTEHSAGTLPSLSSSYCFKTVVASDSVAVSGAPTLQLTQTESSCLEYDLVRKLTKWTDMWTKRADAAVRMTLEYRANARQWTDKIQNMDAALEECKEEAHRVISGIDGMIEHIDSILSFSNKSGTIEVAEDREKAVDDYGEAADYCVEHERVSMWLKDQIVQSSEDLASCRISGVQKVQKRKRRSSGSQERKRLREMLKEVKAFRRVVELEGLCMPKSTFEAAMNNCFLHMSKQVKHHKVFHQKEERNIPVTTEEEVIATKAL